MIGQQEGNDEILRLHRIASQIGTTSNTNINTMGPHVPLRLAHYQPEIERLRSVPETPLSPATMVTPMDRSKTTTTGTHSYQTPEWSLPRNLQRTEGMTHESTRHDDRMKN
jgi:hypothetical protein